MKIEIWADFACPYCYLGESMLRKALAELDMQDDVEVDLHAYELDPLAPQTPTETMLQHFVSAHGIDVTEARKQMDRIAKMGHRLDLGLDIEGVQVCSTLDAHRLVKYAGTVLRPADVLRLSFLLFHANFVENLRLSDRSVLVGIAESTGLDRGRVEHELDSEAWIEAVRADEAEADRMGLEYIPYMRFGNGQLLQGVLSVGRISAALQA